MRIVATSVSLSEHSDLTGKKKTGFRLNIHSYCTYCDPKHFIWRSTQFPSLNQTLYDDCDTRADNVITQKKETTCRNAETNKKCHSQRTVRMSVDHFLWIKRHIFQFKIDLDDICFGENMLFMFTKVLIYNVLLAFFFLPLKFKSICGSSVLCCVFMVTGWLQK